MDPNTSVLWQQLQYRKSDLPGAEEEVSSSPGQEHGFEVAFPLNLLLPTEPQQKEATYTIFFTTQFFQVQEASVDVYIKSRGWRNLGSQATSNA